MSNKSKYFHIRIRRKLTKLEINASNAKQNVFQNNIRNCRPLNTMALERLPVFFFYFYTKEMAIQIQYSKPIRDPAPMFENEPATKEGDAHNARLSIWLY